MSKKKPSGSHKTPRRPVQFPTDWLAVARRLAAKKRQHTVWFLIGLIADEATRQNETDLPPAPWDESQGGDGRKQ